MGAGAGRMVSALERAVRGRPRVETWRILCEPGLVGHAVAGPFAVMPGHVAALRALRFAWSPVLEGGPCVDATRPYGSAAPWDDLARLFGTDERRVLAVRHVETARLLIAALREGALEEDARACLSGRLTGERMVLLRALALRWPPAAVARDLLAGGFLPSLEIDPGRPYGGTLPHAEDRIAELLHVARPLPAQVARDHLSLHRGMPATLRAFVRAARPPLVLLPLPRG